MAMDRLHHSHLGEDHRAAVLRSLRHAMRCGLYLLLFVFRLRDFLCEPIDGPRRVRSFRPLGSNIGSSKRRDQDTTLSANNQNKTGRQLGCSAERTTDARLFRNRSSEALRESRGSKVHFWTYWN